MLYWKERGSKAINAEQIAISIRMFFAFLMQDEAGVTLTIAEAKPVVFERFRTWRMGPHSWKLDWADKSFEGSSTGVTGESVQRNLNDIRAGLNHAALNGRVPYVPKVPNVDEKYLTAEPSQPLPLKTLGAILGYVADDVQMNQWVSVMLATGARPDACLAFNPAEQIVGDMLDMHPREAPRTKKRNAVVPYIEPLKPILENWQHAPVKSRKTAWRVMRRVLGLPDWVIPKSIRTTVATELLRLGVPHEEISRLIGHSVMHRTTARYAHYDPSYLTRSRAALTTLWGMAMQERDLWLADHMRTTGKKGATIVLDRKEQKAQNL
jgi:integrase